jgi:ElaB/YqjD/DUF883 family membrane-anchored ribosome-binding protein
MPNTPALDTDKLHDRLHDTLDHLRTAAASAGDDAEEAVQKATSSVVHAAQELLDHSKARAGRLAKDAAREVREHPIATAAAVTAAAAAVIGIIASQQGRKTH